MVPNLTRAAWPAGPIRLGCSTITQPKIRSWSGYRPAGSRNQSDHRPARRTTVEIEIAVIPPEAVVLRNNITTTVDTLTKDDQITIYYNRNHEPAVVKAFGEVNKSDLLSRLSALVKGRLTTEQIASILAGNWDEG